MGDQTRASLKSLRQASNSYLGETYTSTGITCHAIISQAPVISNIHYPLLINSISYSSLIQTRIF